MLHRCANERGAIVSHPTDHMVDVRDLCPTLQRKFLHDNEGAIIDDKADDGEVLEFENGEYETETDLATVGSLTSVFASTCLKQARTSIWPLQPTAWMMGLANLVTSCPMVK